MERSDVKAHIQLGFPEMQEIDTPGVTEQPQNIRRAMPERSSLKIASSHNYITVDREMLQRMMTVSGVLKPSDTKSRV